MKVFSIYLSIEAEWLCLCVYVGGSRPLSEEDTEWKRTEESVL